MKLLLDQNISYRVVKKIAFIFPDAVQLRNIGLEDVDDLVIWEYAKANAYTIITFDKDFFNLQLDKGFPPKIIWLRIKNTSNELLSKF